MGHEGKKSALEKRIGYSFEDEGLLVRALITVGRANEMKVEEEFLPYDQTQEPLATLGDSVIRLLAVEWLVQEKELHQKGEITQIVSEMVSAPNLSLIAEGIALENYVWWSEGERLREEWHRSPRMLAECLEALIGAIYLDSDLKTCHRVLSILGMFREDRLDIKG